MTPTETSSSIRRKKDRVIGRGGPGSEFTATHAMPTGREAYPDVCLVANQSIEGRPNSCILSETQT